MFWPWCIRHLVQYYTQSQSFFWFVFRSEKQKHHVVDAMSFRMILNTCYILVPVSLEFVCSTHLKVSKRYSWEGSLTEFERPGCNFVGVTKRLCFPHLHFSFDCNYCYVHTYPAWFVIFWVFQRGSGYVNYTTKKQHLSSIFSTKNRDIQSWPSQFQQPASDLGSKEASCTRMGPNINHKPWEERHIHLSNKSNEAVRILSTDNKSFVDYHQMP